MVRSSWAASRACALLISVLLFLSDGAPQHKQDKEKDPKSAATAEAQEPPMPQTEEVPIAEVYEKQSRANHHADEKHLAAPGMHWEKSSDKPIEAKDSNPAALAEVQRFSVRETEEGLTEAVWRKIPTATLASASDSAAPGDEASPATWPSVPLSSCPAEYHRKTSTEGRTWETLSESGKGASILHVKSDEVLTEPGLDKTRTLLGIRVEVTRAEKLAGDSMFGKYVIVTLGDSKRLESKVQRLKTKVLTGPNPQWNPSLIGVLIYGGEETLDFQVETRNPILSDKLCGKGWIKISDLEDGVSGVVQLMQPRKSNPAVLKKAGELSYKVTRVWEDFQDACDQCMSAQTKNEWRQKEKVCERSVAEKCAECADTWQLKTCTCDNDDDACFWTAKAAAQVRTEELIRLNTILKYTQAPEHCRLLCQDKASPEKKKQEAELIDKAKKQKAVRVEAIKELEAVTKMDDQNPEHKLKRLQKAMNALGQPQDSPAVAIEAAKQLPGLEAKAKKQLGDRHTAALKSATEDGDRALSTRAASSYLHDIEKLKKAIQEAPKAQPNVIEAAEEALKRLEEKLKAKWFAVEQDRYISSLR